MSGCLRVTTLAAILVSLHSLGVFRLVDAFTLADLNIEDLSSQTSLNISYGVPGVVRLSGPIPPELGTLVRLTKLVLTSHNLTGGIPPDLANLTSLTYLDISNNSLTGPIPPELGRLVGLTHLQLSQNQLSGPLPAALGSLVNLDYLELSFNGLSGPIPGGLVANLARLQNLQLHSNNLTGPLPPEIGNMASLSILALQHNRINGPIPPQVGNLTNLEVISLHFNQLSGPLPTEFGGLTNLVEIDLWNNSLSGPIPSEIGRLSKLRLAYLSNNSFSGGLPGSLGNLSQLELLGLSNNSLSGAIPGSLGGLPKLTYLGLGNNDLSSSIPPQLGNFPQLDTLDLNDNNLTGPIPPELGNLSSLTTLLLHHNRLSGTPPPELASLPPKCKISLTYNNLSGGLSETLAERFGTDSLLPGNPLLSVGAFPASAPAVITTAPGVVPAGTSSFSPPQPQNNLTQPPTNSSSGGSSTAVVASATAAGAVALVAVALGALLLYRRRKRRPGLQSLPGLSGSEGGPAKTDGSSGRTPTRLILNNQFRLADLWTATDGWDESHVVGRGSFGTVYRATLGDGRVVAVKRLDQRRANRPSSVEERSWNQELAALSTVRHKNLVTFMGACVEGNERLLVFEFFPGGSLGQRLQTAQSHGVPFLSWAERMAVIKGVCRGLAYLHHDISPPMIHRDIKASNILLKGPGVSTACIADFGLAHLMRETGSEHSETTTAVKGTLPYMAPEYLQGGSAFLSTRCDVYSFGVLVLEVLSGRPVTGRAFGSPFEPLVRCATRMAAAGRGLEFVDPAVWDAFRVTEAELCLSIALECAQEDPETRPFMDDVALRLRTLHTDVSASSESKWASSVEQSSPSVWTDESSGRASAYMTSSSQSSVAPVRFENAR